LLVLIWKINGGSGVVGTIGKIEVIRGHFGSGQYASTWIGSTPFPSWIDADLAAVNFMVRRWLKLHGPETGPGERNIDKILFVVTLGHRLLTNPGCAGDENNSPRVTCGANIYKMTELWKILLCRFIASHANFRKSNCMDI
jgi:hypothetical protein